MWENASLCLVIAALHSLVSWTWRYSVNNTESNPPFWFHVFTIIMNEKKYYISTAICNVSSVNSSPNSVGCISAVIRNSPFHPRRMVGQQSHEVGLKVKYKTMTRENGYDMYIPLIVFKSTSIGFFQTVSPQIISPLVLMYSLSLAVLCWVQCTMNTDGNSWRQFIWAASIRLESQDGGH